MSNSQVVTTDTNVVSLVGDLCFHNIMLVRQALARQLDSMQGQIVIDFAEVQQVDSSALSLWLSSFRLAQTKGLSLQPINIPTGMQVISELVGLDDILS